MGKVIFMTNVIRRLGIMQQMLEKLQSKGELAGDYSCWWVTENTEWDDETEKRLAGTDFLLLKWMGTGLTTTFLKRVHAYARQHHIPYYIDAAGGDDDNLIQGITPEQEGDIRLYSLYGGESNLYHLWLYMDGITKGDTDSVSKPDPIHWTGIFHPRAKKVYTDLAEYEKDFCRPGRYTVGILFYRDEWVWGDLEYQSRLVEEIEKQEMNAICVFSNGIPYKEMGMPALAEVFTKFFFRQGMTVIDAFINITKFSLTGSGALALSFLKQWNVPVLEAYTLLSTYEEWKEAFEGMNAMEVSISVSLPEFDGVVHGVPIATKNVLENGDVRYLSIPERIVRIVAKAKKWAAIRHKENGEKKIAIIFHNYPPKNSNIGSGVGLDTIESVRRLLANMRKRGYKVDFIPKDTKEFINILTGHATNDRSLLSAKQLEEANKISGREYETFYDTFEEKVQAQLEKDWGKAPGTVMEYNGKLMVPGTMDGNVFITVQPPRGFGEDPAKIYHSPYCAPTHHYLAFYRWVRDIWQADAVAHIGTHGSLEWLPGKNAGLSVSCYPDLSLGDLPNMYIYNMTITGEGIQAKRRGSACLIGHLNPPTGRADVYEDLAELEKLLDEYAQLKVQQPGSENVVQEKILGKITDMHLEEELPKENLSDDEYILKVHTYVEKLKHMQIRTGLHIFGCPPEREDLREFLLVLTRVENGDVPSLPKVICSAFGQDYYELEEKSGELLENGETGAQLLDTVWDICTKIVEFLMEKGLNTNAVELLLASELIQNLNLREDSALELKTVVRFMVDTLAPDLAKTKQEITNTLRALDGEFIEPGPGGAPTSGRADILPTGRNFYGVDPYNIPTPVAWEIGKLLADQAVNRFIKEEGHYPESIGMVIWSDSNMRSNGQDIAEFFYLMGVRPVWQRGSLKVKDLEVIPLQELKRPRIDVTARISGLFRDTMPAVVELMEEAVNLVKGLDETWEDNYIKKHVEQDAAELEKDGANKETAYEQASWRIFGCPPGGYGAGVAHMIEAKNWETVHDLADVYVRWGAHVYGKKMQGQYLPQLFRKRLSTIEITIKNTDNHEVHLLNSDDFNAYCGGMNAAVHSIRGKMPRCYIGDSADRAKAETRSLGEEIRRVFRGESMNPKYIEGMKKHGYKGASDLANLVAHAYGWDCTSEVLEDWMYEGFAKKLALDPEIREWMNEVNPWALHRVAEKLLEAEQRGMWNALPETKEALRRLYMELEGELEERAES